MENCTCMTTIQIIQYNCTYINACNMEHSLILVPACISYWKSKASLRKCTKRTRQSLSVRICQSFLAQIKGKEIHCWKTDLKTIKALCIRDLLNCNLSCRLVMKRARIFMYFLPFIDAVYLDLKTCWVCHVSGHSQRWFNMQRSILYTWLMFKFA